MILTELIDEMLFLLDGSADIGCSFVSFKMGQKSSPFHALILFFACLVIMLGRSSLISRHDPNKAN